MSVESFVAQIAPLIVAEGQRRGYKVFSTVIAQAIIESRSGESTLGYRYHNYFGLKAGKAWLLAKKPSVSLRTKEEYTVGILTTINDYFRVYDDMASGVAGYYDFISAKRYANLKDATDFKQYAEFLKADGYATSSSYVTTLCNYVTKYGLTKYDIPQQQTGAQAYWIVGQNYVTQQDLYVRSAPNGAKVKFEDLTENAQENAKKDILGNGILKRGTVITCKAVVPTQTCIWIQIPSGWVCAANSKAIYIL